MSIFLIGIQSSGSVLHLGNYIGAILNCKKIIKNLKEQDKMWLMVADLHSLTTLRNASEIRNNINNLIATYIACGINPNDNINFFIQSQIPAHCELCWILSTITPLGHLERMTQFKDKSKKYGTENVNTGLLCYPILMVADIILYDTNYVIVGEDQTQHIEFTRDIVDKFNAIYNTNLFIKPEGIIDNTSKRIMSLGDGTKKMSKSCGEDKDRIFLTDSDDDIAKKIKIAKTDSIAGIYFDKENRPEVSNLINIYSALSGKNIDEISKQYNYERSTKVFKDDLTQIIINEISPIREKIIEISKDKALINRYVKEGTEKANEYANQKISKVKKIIGVM